MALIIPHSHAIHDKPPKYACCLCEKVFSEDEAREYQNHCIRGHSVEDLREHSLSAKAPGLFDNYHESGDVAWQRWIDRKSKERPEQWRQWMKTDEGKR